LAAGLAGSATKHRTGFYIKHVCTSEAWSAILTSCLAGLATKQKTGFYIRYVYTKTDLISISHFLLGCRLGWFSNQTKNRFLYQACVQF
jgi:hypothetical protein